MAHPKKTPIERMFLEILHRKMRAAERRILLPNEAPKAKQLAHFCRGQY